MRYQLWFPFCVLAALALAGCGRSPAPADSTAEACRAWAASAPPVDPHGPPPGWSRTIAVQRAGGELAFGPIDGHYWRRTGSDTVCGLHYNAGRGTASQAPDGRLLYFVEGRLAHLPIPVDQVPQPVGDQRVVQQLTGDVPRTWLGAPMPPGFVYWHGTYDVKARRATATGFWLRHIAVRSFTFDMGGDRGYPFTHRVTPGVDMHFAPKLNFDVGP